MFSCIINLKTIRNNNSIILKLISITIFKKTQNGLLNKMTNKRPMILFISYIECDYMSLLAFLQFVRKTLMCMYYGAGKNSKFIA